jgi:negative regulator of flagellin synthesis FlgM
MEINGKTPVALNASVSRLDVQHQQNTRAPKSGDEGDQLNSDRIELSVRGREIQHLDEMIRSTPDIRTARVEQVRQALESGTYNVKAEMIAEKILGGDLIDEVF